MANGTNGEKVYSKEELDEAVQHAISRRDVKEIKDKLEGMERRFDGIETALADGYVSRVEYAEMMQRVEKALENSISKEQFAPVRNIVYGMVAIILTGVIGAILALVVK